VDILSLCSKIVILGENKFSINFQNFHKTLPVNLKYKAPRPSTTNKMRRMRVIWDPWEGFSLVAGDI
jgi:hypothetical protein